ncbi:hypothetical protein [Polaribacter tangerinus]|uniref:hypothetical protein n=1 Tax=Polaribacter tangerinus TaxID=1920034 RepID=UPI000B4ADC49|nr:hypothetical protein [Polaribacter tangerinus]
MKKNILFVLLIATISLVAQEQKKFEKEVVKISKKIEQITKSQKDSLKVKILQVEKRLKNGEITEATATILKQELASYHAKQIEVKVSEQEKLLQQLVQDKINGKIKNSESVADNKEEVNSFSVGNKKFRFSVSDSDDELEVDDFEEDISDIKKVKNFKLKNKTTSQFVFAMGVNNVLNDNNFSSLNNSEYQFWRSRFYELGFTWKTRISPKPSSLYFKYGISFLWNNLRLENNQFHVKNGTVTDIVVFADKLSESRLRHVQMNFPVHLEWDLSKNKTYSSGKVADRTNQSVRLGLGGFVGFKLGTRQYLEYLDSNNVNVEEVQYDNFNMNTVNYGLSAYVGYKSTSLYLKYDLNPLFKDTEVRNISMGVRLDLN